MFWSDDNRTKRQQAYSMVEILVVSVIIVTVVLIANISLVQEYRLRKVSDVTSELHLNGRSVMDFMSAELRNATRTDVSSPPNIEISIGKDQIQFYLPQAGTIDADGNTVWDTGNAISYYFNSEHKILSRGELGTTRPLVADVFLVQFDDIGTDSSLYADELRVSLVLEKSLGAGQTVTVPFVSTIKMRN